MTMVRYDAASVSKEVLGGHCGYMKSKEASELTFVQCTAYTAKCICTIVQISQVKASLKFEFRKGISS